MKKMLSVPFLIFTLLFTNSTGARAQSMEPGDSESFMVKDTVTKEGYTVIFINKQQGFSDSVKKNMIDVYFKVYPSLVQDFNKDSRKKVTFVIDPSYTGVAATSGGIVRYNPKWFERHPGDIDVVTHEVMHIIQSYGRHAVPSWLTEGIADYVRYKYGVNNEGGGWSLTPFSTTQHYTNSYRVTARFFVWIEKKAPGFVKQMDETIRKGKYAEESWKKLTGKTVDEWWIAYSEDPAL